MKFYDIGIILFVAVICVCIVGGIGSVYLFGPDNPVEKVAEEVIEKETGIDIDLTPKSQQKTFHEKTWLDNPFAKVENLACNTCDQDTDKDSDKT